MFAVAQHGSAVDDDLINAGGKLMRVFVGCLLCNRHRVENRDIGGVTFAQEAAVFSPSARADAPVIFQSALCRGSNSSSREYWPSTFAKVP